MSAKPKPKEIIKDPKGSKDAKDTKDVKDSKNVKDTKDAKDAKDAKDSKGAKDTKSDKPYNNINIDELLSKLTTEQLETLHTELIDPDDYMVPPCDRCRYKTNKSPTFPFSRKKLLDFLEKIAREDKDWDEEKPYTKEKRGNIWKAKEEEKIKFHGEDEGKTTEWDEILNKASEAELVDLAAILGFHGMLNQVQYHQAFVEGKQTKDGAGFQSIAKYAEFKFFEEDKPNEVDIEDCLKRLESNDEKLTELNLNNVKDLTIPDLVDIVTALKNNTKLTSLLMANTRATDKVIKALIPIVETNKTLKIINVESNYISGSAIVELVKAVNSNQVVEELRVSNQRPLTLGVQNEMEIAKLVKMNKSLLKFNVFLNIVTARLLVQRYIQRNIDNIRRKRMGKDVILPMEDEKPYYLQDQQDTKPDAAAKESEDDSSDDSGSEEE